MKKGNLVFVLALVFMVSIFMTACSKDKENDQSNPGKVTEDTDKDQNETDNGETANNEEEVVDPLGRYEETVTIRFFGQKDDSVKYSEGEDAYDNLWTRHYLDKLNIKTELEWLVDSSQYETQLSMAIASQELADIMTFKRGDKNLYTLYEAGQLQDLSEVYEKYASDLTKQIMNYDGGVGLSSCYDGDYMYALPITNPATDSAYMLWIRKDWLEKSGMQAPTTMDQLYELIKNFAENDYDGVDAYGLALYSDLFGGLCGMDGLFNGFSAYAKNWAKDEAGSLVYGGVQEEAKQSLEFLAKLYSEGLLDKEFITKDQNAVSSDLTSGKVGIVFGPQWLPVWPLNAGVGSVDTYDWMSVALPTPDGSYPNPLVPIGVNGYYVVTKDFEHPEALVKMLNLFVENAFGDGDRTYYATNDKYQEPFKLAKVSVYQPDKNIQIWKAVNAAIDGDNSLIDTNQEAANNYASIQKWEENPTAENNMGWGYSKIFGKGGSIGILNDYEQNKALVIDEFYGPTTETMSVVSATLDKLMLQTYIKIITNEAPITEFDNFVAQWNQLGGEDITKEVNEWYNAN